MNDTHMRLTVGHDPATALCDKDVTSHLVTDPDDVTCRRCQLELAEIFRREAAAEAEREREYDA